MLWKDEITAIIIIKVNNVGDKILNVLYFSPNYLITKLGPLFNVRLIDGKAGIFPNSYAATGNRTHVSRVAQNWDL